ncbi:hypothetical protein JB92DRAFT_3084589 [Gautieria morchelliformis]|nr:hypothetical protein JB92DRAFT_3084589 [Gautieria morchelliformis]
MFCLLVWSLLAALAPASASSIHTSIPEDLFAFPKYRLSFLNGLPVANKTAERWLRDGLYGGEQEFLDNWHPNPRHGIDASGSQPAAEHSPTLEHMRLGPSKSYLCLIPPPPTLPPPSTDESQAPVTPSHSWSLLQPLSGTCIYHRQAWFTYSYCHNLHVRQFRELPTTFPHPPGPRIVEEDPEWESYTLGKSPSSHTVDGRLAVNDELALANNLELARQGAGQRYLVQRWSDGTVCDKTGRPREIEVQFHCSMTVPDMVLFVKETRTCEYVLVIHTPRLCGEPGFKSRLQQMPEAAIRCRQIVDDVNSVDRALPEAPQPFKRKPRQPIVQRAAEREAKDEVPKGAVGRAQHTARLLRKALDSLLRGGGIEDLALLEVQPGEQEGEFIFAVETDGEQPLTETAEEPVARGRGATLEEALRAAGYDIRGRKDAAEDDQSEKKEASRDEL